MKKYRCSICNYIYDPEEGDDEGGIKPGTSFEDLPDNWVCPVCGAGRADFAPCEDS
jgi:rubredoxin